MTRKAKAVCFTANSRRKDFDLKSAEFREAVYVHVFECRSGATFNVSIVLAFLLMCTCDLAPGQDKPPANESTLKWESLPPLPDELGVAGPFVGVHNDCLIVAGGANFPQPVWESAKVWKDAIYVCQSTPNGDRWSSAGTLKRPVAYGASVSTKEGVICVGGNDEDEVFSHVFRLRWDSRTKSVQQTSLPPLPEPCVYGQAVLIDDVIYLCCGQTGHELSTATNHVWALDLKLENSKDGEFKWTAREPLRGPARAFSIVTAKK